MDAGVNFFYQMRLYRHADFDVPFPFVDLSAVITVPTGPPVVIGLIKSGYCKFLSEFDHS